MSIVRFLRNLSVAVFAITSILLTGCTTHERVQYSYHPPYKHFAAAPAAQGPIISPEAAPAPAPALAPAPAPAPADQAVGGLPQQ